MATLVNQVSISTAQTVLTPMTSFRTQKSPASGRASLYELNANESLELLVEFTCGARDVDTAWSTAFAILHALDDARRLATLGTIGRFGRIHLTLATGNFGYLGHGVFLLLVGVSAHTHQVRGFNGAVDTARNGHQTRYS